jgi:hypothetical protein
MNNGLPEMNTKIPMPKVVPEWTEWTDATVPEDDGTERECQMLATRGEWTKLSVSNALIVFRQGFRVRSRDLPKKVGPEDVTWVNAQKWLESLQSISGRHLRELYAQQIADWMNEERS